MITKTVRRYYCEHCKKGGQTKAMAKHELSCLKNPQRVCSMCRTYELEQVPIPVLMAAAAESLGDLREATRCPACVLATWMRFTKANPAEDQDYYDYKAGAREFMESLIPVSFH